MISIRPFRPTDSAACLALFFNAVHHGAAQHYSAEQRAAWAPHDRTQGRWEQGDDRATFVAEIAGTIVGFADITHGGELDHLYVDYRYQRRGIGTALITACEEYAQKCGIQRVYTYASALAEPLFLKAGYAKIEDIFTTVHGVEFVIAHLEKFF